MDAAECWWRCVVYSLSHYRTSWQVLSFSSSTKWWRAFGGSQAQPRQDPAQNEMCTRADEKRRSSNLAPRYPSHARTFRLDILHSLVSSSLRSTLDCASADSPQHTAAAASPEKYKRGAEDQQSCQNFDQHRSARTSACVVPVVRYHIIKWLPNCWLLCDE